MEEIIKELEQLIPGATKYVSLNEDGSLALQLEKVNGVWVDVTERELAKQELAKQELEKAKLELQNTYIK